MNETKISGIMVAGK